MCRDCDCVQQLNGALHRIVELKNGILFYLYGASHEGRGASYVCKSRDRMFVQYSHETINTYDIYKTLGLKPDYRRYDHVRDIQFMLGIEPAWVLLTNNPDKIKAFRDLELPVARTEKIDSKPTRFNIAYLRSKRKYGHDLPRATASQDVYDAAGLRLVSPFVPHAVEDTPRFVLAASYYLPVGTVDGYMLVTEAERDTLVAGGVVLHSDRALRGRRWIQIDPSSVPPEEAAEYDPPEGATPESDPRILARDAACILERACYWYRVSLYYDLVNSEVRCCCCCCVL